MESVYKGYLEYLSAKPTPQADYFNFNRNLPLTFAIDQKLAVSETESEGEREGERELVNALANLSSIIRPGYGDTVLHVNMHN